ncbi:Retinoblastoma-binding protein 5 [Thelohanellus kitauei]|uniref:Retinoblastoma-binding protein 5 n=1 Tax=Thelohanellus kitauei TaxID=669202 RepID=A0A0C2NJY4_THEKT|nr:Retinoblastoma-binding protein 5 [Thelohanellus kitauei]
MENTKGKVTVFETKNCSPVKTFSVKNLNSQLTTALEIVFSRGGKKEFLINCCDKTIKIFNSCHVFGPEQNIEPLICFQDLITKSLWRKCCFSGDGEYVIAQPTYKHSIYIWERKTGGLVHILQGSKGDTLGDIECHPTRPIFYSICGGRVSIWENITSETWSAYAPDFKDLEQNVIYEEREDEFDIDDEDSVVVKITEKRRNAINAIVPGTIDITSREIPVFCSSDEDGTEPISYVASKMNDDTIWDTDDSNESA